MGIGEHKLSHLAVRNVADAVCVAKIRLLLCNHAYFNKRDNAGEGGVSRATAEFVSPPGQVIDSFFFTSIYNILHI